MWHLLTKKGSQYLMLVLPLSFFDNFDKFCGHHYLCTVDSVKSDNAWFCNTFGNAHFYWTQRWVRVQMNKINDSLPIFIRPKSDHNDCLYLSVTESLTDAFEIWLMWIWNTYESKRTQPPVALCLLAMFSLILASDNGVLKYAPLKGGGCGERLFRVHEENQLFMNVGHPAR